MAGAPDALPAERSTAEGARGPCFPRSLTSEGARIPADHREERGERLPIGRCTPERRSRELGALPPGAVCRFIGMIPAEAAMKVPMVPALETFVAVEPPGD